MRVNWTEPALEDLDTIQAYIAKDSSFYARQFIERIFDTATKKGYRIIYLPQPEHITIIAVIHDSLDLAGMEDKSW